MDKNFLLTGLKVLSSAVPILKENTRSQLNRTDLISIRAYCSIASQKLNENKVDALFYVNAKLLQVMNIIDSTLSDSSVKETDTDTKEFIVSNLQQAMKDLKIECGKYYTTSNFDYTPQLAPLLNDIINECINSGYYFGIERTL